MQRRTRRTLQSAMLAAGVAALSTGTASGQPVEPGDPNQAVQDAAAGIAGLNPGTVCDNEAVVGPLLLAHPCFDGSQFPPADLDEVGPPSPAPAIPAPEPLMARSDGGSLPASRAPVLVQPDFGSGQDVHRPIVINDIGRLAGLPAPEDADLPALPALDTASMPELGGAALPS